MKKADPVKKESSNAKKGAGQEEDSLIVIEEKAEEAKTEAVEKETGKEIKTEGESNPEEQIKEPVGTEEEKGKNEDTETEPDRAQPVFEENTEMKKPIHRKFFILGLVTVAVAAIIFFIASAFILKSDQDTAAEESAEKSQDQPAPTNTPAATATPTPSREKIQIEVLNGSGIPGLAGKAKEFLESLGYKDIKTGNADSYDYQKTEVSIKKTKEEYLKMILEDLGKNYSVSSDSSTLEKDSPFDIVVILGKKES
ncbi:LytR C-terminal domain-containing protein [Patescibacteria group bacterium]|nr:LytR C-terminal domain-containing protein [Patescibacteria group bacterium]